MKKIRAIIVEDEQSGIDNLRGKLKRNCPNIEIIAACKTGEEAIQSIHDLEPELVFLDIRLGTMTGFDVLERVQHIRFEIIFVTFYDQYAIRAFKVNALDYLLKPISDKELIDAVNKAWWKIQQGQTKIIVAVPTRDGIRVLVIAEIIYCKADNNYAEIHLVNEKPLLISQPLIYMDRKLPASQFFRIHKGYTVNLNWVDSYSREDGGYVVMKNGDKLPVAKSRKDEFLERLMER